ncbi:pyridoxal phosphate-dependent decarboxylase family protein [Hansschlegelia quercus]|uniref:Aminotransferase class V-fold PLP-dependent enzyme n=1 Tax=Hansschlegelia quercus TaxID=2528245 RepID=A0A4Q9GI47_9HYPH|nr:aminotransferase class V-fold PLP-dependent enzyme [Hansschlegelia quercus]TBN53688.1 aminotransferase class V-fold PLP-dependent enzyme [Hansschlegelia quercus]
MTPPPLLREADRAAFEAAFAVLAEAALAGAPSPTPLIPGRPGPLVLTQEGAALEDVLAEMIGEVLPRAARGDHPRAFGFTPSPASPLSRLGDLLASTFNPHAGAWPQAEGPLAVERAMIRFMADAGGFPESAGGLFLAGGSAANLTAVVAAREARLGPDDTARGVAYLSEETHVSALKALRIAGIPDARIRRVALSDNMAMEPTALAAAVETDLAAGLKPFIVIATAGSTRSGAVDPLPAIADICEPHGLWLHVDGALGGSALLSPAHRHLLAGVERADSLGWDAHKWLFQTYGCAALLVRDQETLRRAFAVGPAYLEDAAAGEGEVNAWDLGPEMTRPARALKLWLTLRVMGTQAVGSAVAHGFQLVEWAEAALGETPGWKVVSPARMATLLFRFEDCEEDERDAVNAAAARRLLDDGYASVGTARVDGRLTLRICALHPEATEDDMRETVRRLDRFAREAAEARPSSRPQRSGEPGSCAE